MNKKSLKSTWLAILLLGASEPGWADELNSTNSPDEPDEPIAESLVRPETLTHRAGYKRRADQASAANTLNQLEEDDRLKEPVIRFPRIDQGLEYWYAYKRRLNEESGIQFGFDYNSLYQSANDALTDDDKAWSGAFRILGAWDLVNKGQDNVGTLVFGFESRHAIGGRIPPSALPSQLGYIGVTGTLFNDAGGILGNLYFKQRTPSGKGGYIIGRYDPNDFHDVLGYANPWTTFSNAAVLLNASIALPDWSWGAGYGTWLGEDDEHGRWYVKGAINDANGTITDESFFSDGAEFYKWAEVGWSPSRAEQYFTNVHVMAWHVDEREEKGIDSAHGIAIGANKTWNEEWMVFARLGFSDGAAPIYNETATIGVGKLIRQWSDVFGIGVNWGQPPDDSLSAQWTTEVFYRLQLSQNLQLTPSIQYLVDPALNDQDNDIWIASLRLRVNL